MGWIAATAAVTALTAALAACGDAPGGATPVSPAPPTPVAAAPSGPTRSTEPSAPSPTPAPTSPPGTATARPASPAAPTALPARFIARGTEPFWAATVDGNTLTYATPENQAGTRVAVTRTALADGIEVRGVIDGQALVLTVTRAPCSDGMSDLAYPYAVRRAVGGDVQQGCAMPR